MAPAIIIAEAERREKSVRTSSLGRLGYVYGSDLRKRVSIHPCARSRFSFDLRSLVPIAIMARNLIAIKFELGSSKGDRFQSLRDLSHSEPCPNLHQMLFIKLMLYLHLLGMRALACP